MTTDFSCGHLSETTSVTLRSLCKIFSLMFLGIIVSSLISSEVLLLLGSEIECSNLSLCECHSALSVLWIWPISVSHASSTSCTTLPSSEILDRKAQAEAVRLDFLLLRRPDVTAAIVAGVCLVYVHRSTTPRLAIKQSTNTSPVKSLHSSRTLASPWGQITWRTKRTSAVESCVPEITWVNWFLLHWLNEVKLAVTGTRKITCRCYFLHSMASQNC